MKKNSMVSPFFPARAWLQILRPPNLFTVPGDPLAGYLLAWVSLGEEGAACWWRAALAAGASLCLYAAGLIHNDICDLAEDRRDRPDRPLPSGRISLKSAWLAAVLLAVAGMVLAAGAAWPAMLVAGLLVLTIALYNHWAKRVPILGPLVMGLCRGLSLLLGAAAMVWGFSAQSAPFGTGAGLWLVGIWETLWFPAVSASAIGLTLYIAAVTAVAAGEVQARRIGVKRFFPAVILAAWLAVIFFATPHTWLRLAEAVLAAWALAWAFACARGLRGIPAPAVVQKTIGKLIGGLLFIQAALTAAACLPLAAALFLAFPISRRVARWFYAS